MPSGAGALLPGYTNQTGVDAVNIDGTAETALIGEHVTNRARYKAISICCAVAGCGNALDRAIDLPANYARGRLIFNVCHSIQLEALIAHVEHMVKRMRAHKG